MEEPRRNKEQRQRIGGKTQRSPDEVERETERKRGGAEVRHGVNDI